MPHMKGDEYHRLYIASKDGIMRSISYSLLVATLLTAVSLSAAAQQTKSYSGDVSLGGMVNLVNNTGTWLNLQTVHGVRFEDGGFVGCGTGIITDFANYGAIPVYCKVAQEFDTGVSLKPYIAASVGFAVNDNLNWGLYASPEIGLSLGRLKLFADYTYNNYLIRVTDAPSYEAQSYHTITAGVAVRFGRH